MRNLTLTLLTTLCLALLAAGFVTGCRQDSGGTTQTNPAAAVTGTARAASQTVEKPGKTASIAAANPSAVVEAWKTEKDGIIPIVALPEDKNTAAGRPFKSWMEQQGWKSEFGSPEYFYLQDGALHMVSRPGPVFRDRYSLAIFDREKLINGMENKVLLELAGGPDFRIDHGTYPLLHFTVTPVKLPGKGADLRDPSMNDAAFYLLVGFDTERHDFEGRKMPETVAYVWANKEWDKPIGTDPDYSAFMRYVSIGHGTEELGQPHEITRDIAADYRKAYPEKKDRPVPDVIKVGLMIDSNTVKSTAESVLHGVQFMNPEAVEGRPAKDSAAADTTDRTEH